MTPSHPYPLARRTGRIAPFHVMQVVARAAVLQAAGRPVIHMSIGEPDFTAPAPVIDALERAARAGHTQYTSANGLPALRAGIALDYARRHGVDVDPARIVVTAGASAALSLACCALVDVGDEVLMTDPGYPCNRHFVAAFDGVPRPLPVGPDTRFQLTRAMIDAHWGDATCGALIASPANPTGTSIPFDELARIVDGVRARGGFTIVDEIYLGLHYGDSTRTALELGEDIIVSNSFSKYFHMTGWRLGWLVVPASLAATFEKLAQNLYICASTLAQHAALACFHDESQAVYRERREEFRRRRDYVVPALNAIGLPVPVMPDGAFYAWADCSAHTDDSARFADELLERTFVSVVPGMDFGIHEARSHLRVSYATSMDRIEEAVSRIGGYLRDNRR